MRGRYEVDDLLKLRASPLVAKPPGLPPKEEWMGPLDTRPRAAPARGKPEDAFSQAEGFQKRPNLLDSGRRSTTDPERIHLGPPRHSFASSNAGRTRNGTHERTKTNEEIDPKDSDRTSLNHLGLNGRFGARTEEGVEGKPYRKHNDDVYEGRPRRDHDRPRWNEERDSDKNGRSGRDARSKFEQSWIRKDKPGDLDNDSPVWRRGGRDRDIDRHEEEPEWADVGDSAEPAKAHTQEDFAAWLAKMKNKNVPEDKNQPQFEEKEASERPPPRVMSDSSPSVDRFFAKFEEKKTAEAGQTGARPTKSRFASIFGAKEEFKPATSASDPANTAPQPIAELEQPPPPPDHDKKANDAAFAKLLEMLNKNQPAPTPASSQMQSTRSPVNIAELASTRSPDLTSTRPQAKGTPVSSHTPNLSLDRIIESRSPAHNGQHELSGQAKAGPQDLLDLLRRSTINEKQPQQPSHMYSAQQEQRMPQPPPPGLARPPGREAERHMAPLINTRRDVPRSIFDDPAYQGYRGEPDYQQRPSQPSDHGGLGNLLAAMNKEPFNANVQQQRQPPAAPPQGLPPGLQRPPGLSTVPPPPPPGWLGNVHRQAPQNYAPTTQQPTYGHNGYPLQPQQPQQPRQMPPRKPTSDLPLPPAYSNVPPGFGANPNYSSPTSPDGPMYGMRGYAMNERDKIERERQQQQQQQQQPPPPPPNAFAAMYGNSNRGGPGGVRLPPGFR